MGYLIFITSFIWINFILKKFFMKYSNIKIIKELLFYSVWIIIFYIFFYIFPTNKESTTITKWISWIFVFFLLPYSIIYCKNKYMKMKNSFWNITLEVWYIFLLLTLVLIINKLKYGI